jgi:hypothetical protein
MIGIAVFRALCRKVTEEKDTSQIELLKERMRQLLTDTDPKPDRKRNGSSKSYVN